MKKRNILTAAVCALLLAGCSPTDTPQMENPDPLTHYENLPDEVNYKVYDEDGLKSFIEHGTGVVILVDTDDSESDETVYAFHDLLVEYDMEAGFYEVTDESVLDDLFSGSSVLSQMETDCPMVIFVQKGEVISVYEEDCFEENLNSMENLSESLAQMKEIQLQNEKDACDDGCKLG